MNKHIADEKIQRELIVIVTRYKTYGYAIFRIIKILGISLQRYYFIRKKIRENTPKKPREKKPGNMHNANRITQEEQEKVVAYALAHAQYYHRELTYRMMDEDVVYISESSCYRILRDRGLIRRNGKNRFAWVSRYSNQASAPDELWQADITYLRHGGKDVYQLSFIDVYSRFVVFTVTLANMTSDTVTSAFEKYISVTKNTLRNAPRLQTDNGSCFIGGEFKSLINKYALTHVRTHAYTPTENAIIERWHRTFKEILLELDEPQSFGELQIITQACVDYYNYDRYHKSLGYVTPATFYRGEPEKIFDERRRKLLQAQALRRSVNKINENSHIFLT